MLTLGKKSDMKHGDIAPREEHVGRFIPYSRLVDPNTIKTKEGFLIQVIKLEGLSFETADQIDLNQKKNVRATMLKAISNSRFALYQHTIRREAKGRQEDYFENSWCKELDERYQDRLDTKRMFVNEQYLTIVRRPAQSKIGLFSEVLKTISSKVDRKLEDQREEDSLKALKEAVSNLTTTLAPYKPEVLTLEETPDGLFSQTLGFLSYLINFEHTNTRPPQMSLSDYLPRKRISLTRLTGRHIAQLASCINTHSVQLLSAGAAYAPHIFDWKRIEDRFALMLVH